MERVREKLRGPLGGLIIAAVTAAIAAKTIAGVVALIGHGGVTLDDSYIHFQYARAIAEGHPLRYQAGEPVSTGATSMLWPLLLAPFHAIGFRDVALSWPAWALSFGALGLLARDAAALVRPLAGVTAAVISAALVLSFGGHVWCAASGMEVVPFAWLVVHTLRRTIEWLEGERGRKRLVTLLLAANAAALMRPEGLVFAVIAAVALMVAGGETDPEREGRPRFATRALGLVAIALPLVATLALRAVSGSALTNTAVAKLLFFSPYLQGPALRTAIAQNFRVFFHTILEGEVWSAEFVPSGGAFVALFSLVAIAVLGFQRRRTTRAALIVLLALAMMIPCFYVTFLWNRLRYLWPFATGWLIGLACLAHLVAAFGKRFGLPARVVEPVLGGLFVGLFAAKLPWVLEDVAQSASGIDRQQVAAGRWASANLPPDARIGINDAGAIAYFGNRKTFDVVGLTTSGEARYWLAGVASRFEHYEKLPANRLPTHFIVYPEWMGTDVVLGARLAEFTVLDSTILGGRTKRAHVADWSLLRTGELPTIEVGGAIVDSLDVADLESERAHVYSLDGARDGEQVVRMTESPRAGRIADGGRTDRTHERFAMRFVPGVPHRLIVRFEAPTGATIKARVGNSTAQLSASPGEWSEHAFPLVALTPLAEVTLEANEPITVYHYWLAIDGERR